MRPKKGFFIIGVSFLAAIIAGAITTMPALLTGLLIGSIQDGWSGGSSQDRSNSELTRFTIYFVYLFLGEMVSCYIANIGFIRTVKTLPSLTISELEKYQLISPPDADLIRDVSVAVQCSASVIAASVIGFMRDWRWTLTLASSIVCITLVFAAGGILLTKHRQQWLGETEASGSIVQEVFSSIRMVMGLNAQSERVARYDSCLAKAERALLGAVFAVIYLAIKLRF
ncbi:ABC transporter [Penicillium hordei]|uniref:ABC transporter n=1 Tax=Penicillium hordei TaxID=40994 RepID=A0AAD6DYC6_9EURO|nr:ABC transporter [Penicillium hordei]KAJ5597252.1 ABC transporter [Penicillium hordei]